MMLLITYIVIVWGVLVFGCLFFFFKMFPHSCYLKLQLIRKMKTLRYLHSAVLPCGFCEEHLRSTYHNVCFETVWAY